jgi:hypothetical protein
MEKKKIPCKIKKNAILPFFFHYVHIILMNLRAHQSLQDTQNILSNIYNVCV